MSLDIFKQHLELLHKTILPDYGLETYNTTLFGGEPLLNFELIRQILPILTTDHKCMSITLITNGLLLDQEKLDFLRKNKVGISWSFDGLWHHNPDDISKFKEIRKLLPQHTCKAMVSPDRSHSLRDNYVWFIKEFNMLSPDFSIVRDAIWTPDDVEKYKKEIKELADEVIAFNINNDAFSMPSPFYLFLLDTVVGKIYGKRNFGCFAGCHGAAFMPNGIVYPCARYGSVKKSPLYDKNGRYTLNIAQYRDPNNIDPCKFDRCKRCELFQYCNAGCTFSQESKGFTPLPEICEIFKATYEQSFRIVDELKCNTNFKNYLRGILKEKSLCL